MKYSSYLEAAAEVAEVLEDCQLEAIKVRLESCFPRWPEKASDSATAYETSRWARRGGSCRSSEPSRHLCMPSTWPATWRATGCATVGPIPLSIRAAWLDGRAFRPCPIRRPTLALSGQCEAGVARLTGKESLAECRPLGGELRGIRPGASLNRRRRVLDSTDD